MRSRILVMVAVVWGSACRTERSPRAAASSSAAAAATAPATSVPTADTTWSDSVDLTGYYFVMAPIPNAAAGIDYLTLSTFEVDPAGAATGTVDVSRAPPRAVGVHPESTKMTVRAVPLWGDLRFTPGPEMSPIVLRLTSVHVAGRELTFETDTMGGVMYDFRGAFLRRPGYEKYGEPVLAGHWRKFVRGVIAGEADVRFLYSQGD